MLIATQKGIISIVQDKDFPDRLVARGRTIEAIKQLNKTYISEIRHTPKADYEYRATFNKAILALIIKDIVLSIDYPNFKDSLEDPEYHDLIMELWITIKLWYQGGK